MIYFHICSLLKNNTNEQLGSALNKFCNDYKNRNSIDSIGKITSCRNNIFILKLSPFNIEIIIEEKKIDIKEDVYRVYFLRSIKNTLQETVEIRDGKWINYHPLPEVEITHFKKNFKGNHDIKTKKLPPSQDMIEWQNNYKLNVKYDIYETLSWTEFAINSSNEDGMKLDEVKLYCVNLEEVVNDLTSGNLTKIEENNYISLYSYVFKDIGIVYCQKIKGDDFIYLLINGANVKTQSEHWQNVLDTSIAKIFPKQNYEFGEKSLKAYPSFALKDKDLWTRIQKNNELGNLSLLPEQIKLLRSFKYPKYINGQAGSGKSTMLYYLFANVAYYKIAGQIKGDIIFLSENEKLLDHTKGVVIDLLEHNPEFIISEQKEFIGQIDNFFSSFKTFLISLLPEDCDGFSEQKFLDFPKFKKLYESSNIADYIKNKYSAELVWFVTSTYIYGQNIEFNISSSNYDEKMPGAGKEIISKEIFSAIEKEVVKPFYAKLLESEGYWDRSKLIRYLSLNVNNNDLFDVVFCDEAQDFSRIELDFIIHLSSYSKYNLKNVKQFPVVFAGDAFQTVNPTGFRSEVLKSMIYEELTAPKINFNLDSQNLELSLDFNYRSSKAIVELANSIQYHRKTSLDSNIKNPQISKRAIIHEHENLNVFVDFQAFGDNQKLQKKVGYKTIIVPVNREELSDYIADFPILESFDNIISSVDAKGLEFNEVVVFGFGEHYLKNRSNFELYEKRFFFNKLYVAATRAQSELVIIDSTESKILFWKEMIDNYIKSNWSPEESEIHNIEDLMIFNADEVIQSSKTIVRFDAQKQKEIGLLEGNISLLQISASHFIKLGDKKEYYIICALIEELKYNWTKAGSFYLRKEVGDDGLALAQNAYWKGQCLEEFQSLSESNPSQVNVVKSRLCELLMKQTLLRSDYSFFYENNLILKKIIKATDWSDRIFESFEHILDHLTDEEDMSQLCDLLVEIAPNSSKSILLKVGKLYFKLNRLLNAIEVFNNIGYSGEVKLLAELGVAKKLNKTEEIIILLGRLAIETKRDKLKTAKEITEEIMLSGLKVEISDNLYVVLYSFVAFLVVKPFESRTLSLAILTEKLFIAENRIDEYLEKMFNIFESKILNELAFTFLLKRWARLNFVSNVSTFEINKKYKVLTNNSKYPFLPFEEKEVKEIPKTPSFLFPEFPNHIKSIELVNFRQFKSLMIEDFGLVNLIVGDNNIGKTSLLEALLFTPKEDVYLKRLAIAYIKRINIFPDKEVTSESEKLYYKLDSDFLNQYRNYNSESDFGINFHEGRDQWKYVISKENKTTTESTIIVFDDFKILDNIPIENVYTLPYLPFGKSYSSFLATLFDLHIKGKPELERMFVQNLQLFIPTANQVLINSKGEIDIRETNVIGDKPLSQYGEGSIKLFRILLLFTIHKGDRVLIDEIDTGIHFSRFKNYLKIIIDLSHNTNTQLFATTHNDECILVFNELYEEYKDVFKKQARIVQLRKTNEIIGRSYSFDDFNFAYQEGVELR